jgi:NIPSNAP
MIIERRAYTLKPGASARFWEAQTEWNATGPYADVLAVHNLSYFESIAGPCDQIIELHRYSSVDQWQALAGWIYRNSPPDYFNLIRPILIAQENGFFVPAPIEELKPAWAGGPLESPHGLDREAHPNAAALFAVETVLDLQPGGPPLYWEAYRKFLDAEPELARHHLIGAYTSLIGALHRVIHHRWFASLDEAAAYKAQLKTSAAWLAFAEVYRPWILRDHTAYMRVAPVPLLHSVFHPGRTAALGTVVM